MSLQKYPYIRSPALLKACRAIPCTNCGRDDGTVVAAQELGVRFVDLERNQ